MRTCARNKALWRDQAGLYNPRNLTEIVDDSVANPSRTDVNYRVQNGYSVVYKLDLHALTRKYLSQNEYGVDHVLRKRRKD